jgi:hypothetical protein
MERRRPALFEGFSERRDQADGLFDPDHGGQAVAGVR